MKFETRLLLCFSVDGYFILPGFFDCLDEPQTTQTVKSFGECANLSSQVCTHFHRGLMVKILVHYPVPVWSLGKSWGRGKATKCLISGNNKKESYKMCYTCLLWTIHHTLVIQWFSVCSSFASYMYPMALKLMFIPLN